MKELFQFAFSSGIGLPATTNGLPQDSWTADALADALSQLMPHDKSIEVRTVQLWLQANQRGIGPRNIAWLSEIFGCGDPEHVWVWRRALSHANSLLAQRRKEIGKAVEASEPNAIDITAIAETLSASGAGIGFHRRHLGDSLASFSENFFSQASSLNVPVVFFAAAVFLGYLSIVLGIHDVTYLREEGLSQQVGFLWAPNWTISTVVVFPLYLATISHLTNFWLNEGRSRILSSIEKDQRTSWPPWISLVRENSVAFLANFIISIPVVFLFKWIDNYAKPIITGNTEGKPIDWGLIGVLQPEIINSSQALFFTGVAYLYIGISVYFYFTGLILIFTAAIDVNRITRQLNPNLSHQELIRFSTTLQTMINSIGRSVILGLFLAIFMKLDHTYLTTDADSLMSWLAADLRAVFKTAEEISPIISDFSFSTHFSTYLILLVTLFVFSTFIVLSTSRWRAIVGKNSFSNIQATSDGLFHLRYLGFTCAIIGLSAAFAFIGAFSGFSILVIVSFLLALFILATTFSTQSLKSM